MKDRIFRKSVSDEASGCWNWVGTKTERGYGQLVVDNHRWLAHRFSYEAFRGIIPSDLFVCHSCDNPSCVNPEHLFLGTHADNMTDKIAKGRQAKGAKTSNPMPGERNGSAKISREDVIAIRSAKGVKQKDLALIYGVSQTQISQICRGLKWAHI